MNQFCKKLALFLVMATLAACGGQYRNHGYMPLAENVDSLIVGVDTRDSIIEVMGVPTTGGVSTEEAMYYVRSRVQANRSYRVREAGTSIEMLHSLPDIRRCDEYADIDFKNEDEVKRFVRPSRWLSIDFGRTPASACMRVFSRSVGFAMKLATPPAAPPAAIIFHTGVSRGVPAPSAFLIGLYSPNRRVE